MNKRILISLSVIAAVAAIAIGGTVAYFSDTETSTGNTFSAATLDLEAGGPGFSQPISVSGMKPGDDTGYFKWIIKNTGSIPGKISVTFSPITNDENGINEPEQGAESQPYATTTGELGQYLKPGVDLRGVPGVTIIECNDNEGWCIGSVDEEIDTGGTIGWGPKGWSVPSNLYSIWQAGPPHPWGTPGLNGLGGKTYGTFGYLPGDILNPGQEVAFFFRVKLDNDLQRWDGTKWVDVDDNIIQSDSVRFDITFRLDQVTP
jgi:predicted ribosomally synthesized peptide with SipW-like signal peptide